MTSAGDCFCDLFIAQPVYLQINMASAGLLYNWMDLSNVCDFSQPYWNQTVIENLSVNGVLLANAGDYIWTNVSGIVFNKDILTEENIEYPYDMVYNGTWTLDTFLSLTKNLSKDMDGNGIMDASDRYAWSCPYRDYLTAFMYGADLQAVTIEDNYPVILSDLTKMNTLVEKVYELIYNDDRTIIKFDGTNEINFNLGQTVFDLRVISSYLRDLEFSYGILPLPKFNEAQTQYYTNTFNELMVLPITLEDPEFSGLVCELLNAESRLEYLPAYMETLMEQKVAQETDDQAMITLLYNNIVWDFGYVYANWNNIAFTIPWMMRDATTNVNAWYDAYAPAFEQQLAQLYEKICTY